MPAPRRGARGLFCCRVALLGVALVGAWSCRTTDVELLGDGNGRVIREAEPEPLSPEAPSPEAPQLEPGALAPDAPAADGVSALGCPSVDFLFVVDNSRSMREEQDNLARSFPGFIDVVQNQLRTRDHHVMVVDTDASGGAAGLSDIPGLLSGAITCRPAPACCRLACGLGNIPFVNVDSCNDLTCEQVRSAPEPDPCEGALGAGKRLDPDGGDCGVPGSERYLSDSTGLPEAFSCVARVGTFGDGDEQPMGALLEAVGSQQSGGDGCNAGFLRDDAVLVVTIISDEDDESSPGAPAVWHDALLRAKGGNPAGIVVLGLIGDGDDAAGDSSGTCGDEAEPAPRLREFVESFPFGSLGSVCAADYAPFLQRAVSVIDDACVEFQSIR